MDSQNFQSSQSVSTCQDTDSTSTAACLPAGFRRSARVGSQSAVFYEESDCEEEPEWEHAKGGGGSPGEDEVKVQWGTLRHAACTGGVKKIPLESHLQKIR